MMIIQAQVRFDKIVLCLLKEYQLEELDPEKNSEKDKFNQLRYNSTLTNLCRDNRFHKINKIY